MPLSPAPIQQPINKGGILESIWARWVVALVSYINGLQLASDPVSPVTLTDAAAPNNTIYFSSTASKLVYKDAGGTVHALY